MHIICQIARLRIHYSERKRKRERVWREREREGERPREGGRVGGRERERESSGMEFYLKNPTPPGAAQAT
jgi:hypothetical protein